MLPISPRHWVTLARLSAPLHLGTSVAGDLVEDFPVIAQKRGDASARRWLAAQVISSIRLWFWDDIKHSPGQLTAGVALGLLAYFAIGEAFARILPVGPEAYVLRFAALPFATAWVATLFLRGKELSVGFLSASILTCLLLPAKFYAIAGGIGWITGAGLCKWQRVKRYRSKEEGPKAVYQTVAHFQYSSVIAAPVETVFAFHERPDAIQVLTPWWLFPRFERLCGKGLEAGVEVMVTTAGFAKWHARHVAYERNSLFVDEMVSGPMKSWRHEHHFQKQDGGTLLTDSIDFVPIGPAWLVKWGLGLLFRFRHAVTRTECDGS